MLIRINYKYVRLIDIPREGCFLLSWIDDEIVNHKVRMDMQRSIDNGSEFYALKRYFLNLHPLPVRNTSNIRSGYVAIVDLSVVMSLGPEYSVHNERGASYRSSEQYTGNQYIGNR